MENTKSKDTDQSHCCNKCKHKGEQVSMTSRCGLCIQDKIDGWEEITHDNNGSTRDNQADSAC